MRDDEAPPAAETSCNVKCNQGDGQCQQNNLVVIVTWKCHSEQR
jgi:hypothetical protein